MQRPGIEPGPPAWQARILPLNQRCLIQWLNELIFIILIIYTRVSLSNK